MAAADEWTQQQWGTVELRDKRGTARAVKMGAQMAAYPHLLLPGQMQSWGDLKSVYWLLNQEEVAHEALSLPHWQPTRQAAVTTTAPVLFVQNDTLLDFTCCQIEGVGQVRDRKGRGLMVYSTLAIQPGDGPAITRLAHQKVWAHQGPVRGNKANRSERYLQSKNWHATLAAIGEVP